MEETNQFEVGDKIQFALPDKDAKDHWFDGVIHGVRHYEDEKHGKHIRSKTTYLVDTGRAIREEVIQHDLHNLAKLEMANKIIHENTPANFDERNPEHVRKMHKVVDAAHAEVAKTKLPKVGTITEVIDRQPEQLELPPEKIRRP